jgi:hypothetical protein
MLNSIVEEHIVKTNGKCWIRDNDNLLCYFYSKFSINANTGYLFGTFKNAILVSYRKLTQRAEILLKEIFGDGL